MDRTSWIAVILCVVGLLGWGWWNSKQVAEHQRRQSELLAQKAAEQEPQTGQEGGEAVKGAPGEKTPPAGAEAQAVVSPKPSEPSPEEKKIVLENKVARYTFSNHGAGILTAELLDHPATLEEDSGYVTLNRNGSSPIGALSSGPLQMDQSYWKVDSQTADEVVFSTVTPDKFRIEKRFHLPEQGREPHLMDLQITIKNEGEQAMRTGVRYLFTGSVSPLHKDEWPRQTGFFWKAVKNGMHSKGSDAMKRGGKFLGMGGEEKAYHEVEVDPLEWAGVNGQFFTTLVKPSEPYGATIWASRFPVEIPGEKGQPDEKKKPHAVQAGIGLPELMMNAGDQQTLMNFEIYLGPKEFRRLKNLGDDRQLVMNYADTPLFGWMFGWAIQPLASWLIQGLVALKKIVGYYGIAIILITIIIRTLIWPVYAKSTRTMKRMSKLNPLMAEIKEKYKDDQQKQSEELMKLYRDYGVNPLGGCLPMFIQLPVFLAFYGMLWRAVELRHQSFLWIQDLSMPDTLFQIPGLDIPFNLLPLIMAVTTFIQMQLTPKTGDKTQQTIFMLMPLFFLVICYNFAAALALYWTTQNIFSIGQTWLMNKLPEPELKKKKKPKGGGFLERMQEQAKARQSGGGSAAGGGGRTKLAGERGDRHTKSKRKKKH